MTDLKISQLTALVVPADVDLLAIVDDPGGTPVTKKITVTNFLGAVPVNIVQGDALNIQTDKVRARDGDGLYLVDDGNNGILVEDGGVARISVSVYTPFIRFDNTNASIGGISDAIVIRSNGDFSGTDLLRIDRNSGTLFINESANAKMTVGMTINQGASDDEILALKSSDVAHALTTDYEADTYGSIKKAEATSGGLMIVGLKDGDGVAGHALHLKGILDEVAADTTKSAAGIGVITLDGALEGTNVAVVCGANENLVVIRSLATTRFIFDQEGEMHSDDVIGVGDDWDEWDDLVLATDLSRLPKAKFNEMMKYKAEDFERAGLLTLSTDEHGNRHAFIRHKAMLQFTMCCFAEVTQRMKRYEQALLSLGVTPKLLEA